VASIFSKVRLFIVSTAATVTMLHSSSAAEALATLSREAARARLETLGLPLGPDAFARAVATRHRPIIDLCFTAGLEMNAGGPHGRTPLLLATLAQDWELARRLLDAGAAVETADDLGITPLMAAAGSGHVETLRAFLERGANADVVDQARRTALAYAVAAEKLDAIELLLPFTPRLNAPFADGRDLLTLAAETQNAKVLKAILTRLPPTLIWTPATRQAFSAALLAADRDQIRLLLSKHPAPPALQGRSTPLMAYAIAMNDAPLFNILLTCGADPSTALPAPCEKEFLVLLPNSFLRHYVEEDSGVTLLMLAAGLGKADYVRALLATGADRNRSTSKFKMLALYFAARTESWEGTQLLLGSGPKPEELRVEISLASQQAVVFKEGAPVFSTEISTGRDGFSTPAGRYVITDKDRNHRSTIYKVPMPYFMRLNCRDFGMHEGAVPNYPASHGCIRLPSSAARKLFSEIPVGTLVTIN
jgi:ankyrin repeat protein